MRCFIRLGIWWPTCTYAVTEVPEFYVLHPKFFVFLKLFIQAAFVDILMSSFSCVFDSRRGSQYEESGLGNSDS